MIKILGEYIKEYLAMPKEESVLNFQKWWLQIKFLTNNKKIYFILLNGTPSPTRTDMNRSSTDFESVASTNSAIGAFRYIYLV